MNYDYVFKIVVIGDAGVGKSSFISRFVDNTFDNNYMSTIGIDFKIKTIELDNKIIKLLLWDTAGQERFKTITHSYYRGAHGIIIVYSVTSRESFNNINNWLEQINIYANEDVVIALVANKSDLNGIIDFDEGYTFAKDRNIIFYETSVKDNINIEDLFISLTSKIKENIKLIDNINLNNKQLIKFNSHINTSKCCY